MSQTIPATQVLAILHGMAEKVRQEEPLLTKLDSVTGDGDHGTAMVRSVDAMEKDIADNPDAGLKDLFGKIGWTIMSASGGSTGPLLGTLFMGFGDAVEDGQDVDPVAMLLSGITKLHAQSKANVGDRTMMDALLPAADVLKSDGDAPPAQVLQDAAKAATDGAEATKEMLAKFGRARNLGDRVLGSIDPGAMSMSLIMQAFAEAINE